METIPIFSIALHKFFEPELAVLGKKIVMENRDIFRKIEKHNSYTNIIFQNIMKNHIDENYKNLNDILKFKEKILSNATKVLELYNYTYDMVDYEVTNLWFNIMENMSFQNAHNHYGFVLTGTFYIDMPEEVSPIIFYSPLENMQPYNSTGNIKDEEKKHNQFNSKAWTVYPKNGEMYFWLASLSHGVPQIQFSGSRISCSYDISTKI